MKNAPMRFCGLTFGHNPEKLVIEAYSNVFELMPPCCEPDSVYLGERRAVIKGEGELYGADCMEQFAALEAFHRSHAVGKLTLPHRKPIYACLKELELIAAPVDDVIRYRFVFTQAKSPRRASDSAEYCSVGSSGGSLWDIAYRYNTSVERLVELNPDISLIDSIAAGVRVRIC